jgi:hypothetical protein
MTPERQSQAKKRRMQPSRASWVLVTSGFPPRGLRKITGDRNNQNILAIGNCLAKSVTISTGILN